MKKLLLLLSFVLLNSTFAADHVVTIEGFAFNPAVITVEKGDTITFKNLDRAPHNVIPREQSLVQFEGSTILRTGDSFTLEVSESEDILAHCGVHPRMPGIEIQIIQ